MLINHQRGSCSLIPGKWVSSGPWHRAYITREAQNRTLQMPWPFQGHPRLGSGQVMSVQARGQSSTGRRARQGLGDVDTLNQKCQGPPRVSAQTPAHTQTGMQTQSCAGTQQKLRHGGCQEASSEVCWPMLTLTCGCPSSYTVSVDRKSWGCSSHSNPHSAGSLSAAFLPGQPLAQFFTLRIKAA